MNELSFWQCLSVQEFFNGSNWEGRQIAEEGELFEGATAQVPWLCLSLEEFFKQSNWEGKAILKQTSAQQTSKELSLTLSVAEFFKLGAWGGKLGMAPPAPKSKPVPSQKQSPKLSNLSDLF